MREADAKVARGKPRIRRPPSFVAIFTEEQIEKVAATLYEAASRCDHDPSPAPFETIDLGRKKLWREQAKWHLAVIRRAGYRLTIGL
jgi:hypothetical protein